MRIKNIFIKIKSIFQNIKRKLHEQDKRAAIIEHKLSEAKDELYRKHAHYARWF